MPTVLRATPHSWRHQQIFARSTECAYFTEPLNFTRNYKERRPNLCIKIVHTIKSKTNYTECAAGNNCLRLQIREHIAFKSVKRKSEQKCYQRITTNIAYKTCMKGTGDTSIFGTQHFRKNPFILEIICVWVLGNKEIYAQLHFSLFSAPRRCGQRFFDKAACQPHLTSNPPWYCWVEESENEFSNTQKLVFIHLCDGRRSENTTIEVLRGARWAFCGCYAKNICMWEICFT